MDLNVTNTLQQYLEAHSVPVSRDGNELIAGRMKASACIYRKPSRSPGHLLQLDVRVDSPLIAGRTLIESFAGWGSDEKEAIAQAWDKFARSSLHVLLEVFVGENKGEDQIDWEVWDGGTSWRACIGPLFIMGFDDRQPSNLACGELLDSLKDVLLPALTRQCHWLRLYYMRNGNSCVGSECLLDNEDCLEGGNLLNHWNWPDGSYSVRLFLILLPSSQS